MAKFIHIKDQNWVSYKPPTSRDIRIVFPKFWHLSSALKERKTRISILSCGEADDQFLANVLASACGNQPATVMCCPIATRRFQIFYAGRAMKIAKQYGNGFALTLIDPDVAVPFAEIDKIDWRKLHLQLRRRLERILGRDSIVFGMGEIEPDYKRKVWQPHYHLAVFSVDVDRIKELKKRHYKKQADGVRRMKKQTIRDEGWYSYLPKLIAFRKIVVVGSDGRSRKQRKRMKAQESRQFFRYISSRQPTTFVFSMNCSIVKKQGSVD